MFNVESCNISQELLHSYASIDCFLLHRNSSLWFLNLKCLLSKIQGLKRNKTNNDDRQNNVDEVKNKANYQALDLKSPIYFF